MAAGELHQNTKSITILCDSPNEKVIVFVVVGIRARGGVASIKQHVEPVGDREMASIASSESRTLSDAPVCEIFRQDLNVNLGLQVEPRRGDFQEPLVLLVLPCAEIKESDAESQVPKKRGADTYLVERHTERAAEGTVVVSDGETYARPARGKSKWASLMQTSDPHGGV